MSFPLRDRDELLELIGKRMQKLHVRSLRWIDRIGCKKVDVNFWQALYYFNPNIVYKIPKFSQDTKLKILADEYMDNYAGVKARIMRSFS